MNAFWNTEFHPIQQSSLSSVWRAHASRSYWIVFRDGKHHLEIQEYGVMRRLANSMFAEPLRNFAIETEKLRMSSSYFGNTPTIEFVSEKDPHFEPPKPVMPPVSLRLSIRGGDMTASSVFGTYRNDHAGIWYNNLAGVATKIGETCKPYEGGRFKHEVRQHHRKLRTEAHGQLQVKLAARQQPLTWPQIDTPLKKSAPMNASADQGALWHSIQLDSANGDRPSLRWKADDVWTYWIMNQPKKVGAPQEYALCFEVWQADGMRMCIATNTEMPILMREAAKHHREATCNGLDPFSAQKVEPAKPVAAAPDPLVWHDRGHLVTTSRAYTEHGEYMIETAVMGNLRLVWYPKGEASKTLRLAPRDERGTLKRSAQDHHVETCRSVAAARTSEPQPEPKPKARVWDTVITMMKVRHGTYTICLRGGDPSKYEAWYRRANQEEQVRIAAFTVLDKVKVVAEAHSDQVFQSEPAVRVNVNLTAPELNWVERGECFTASTMFGEYQIEPRGKNAADDNLILTYRSYGAHPVTISINPDRKYLLSFAQGHFDAAYRNSPPPAPRKK